MGSMSWIHWALVIAIALLLFGGRGKLSGLMGDAAKGIRAFKDGLKGEEHEEEEVVESKPLPKASASASGKSTTTRKKTTARS